MFFLTRYTFSSLVIDALCDEAGEAGEDISVACFYLVFCGPKGAICNEYIGGTSETGCRWFWTNSCRNNGCVSEA